MKPRLSTDELKEAEEIVHGSARKIIDVLLKEKLHQMEMEKHIITSQTSQRKRGQWMSWVVALALIFAAFFLIYKGHELAGAALGVADVVALVVRFIKGKNS